MVGNVVKGVLFIFSVDKNDELKDVFKGLVCKVIILEVRIIWN